MSLNKFATSGKGDDEIQVKQKRMLRGHSVLVTNIATHAAVKQISRDTGLSMSRVVERAVQDFQAKAAAVVRVLEGEGGTERAAQ